MGRVRSTENVTLRYNPLTLPYSTQIRIADRLSLLSDEDAGLDSAALFERIHQRALEKGCLARLWEYVSEAQPGLEMSINPYEKLA